MTANHRPLEEGDIELIESIRATPCLYDPKDPDFRLIFKKEQQWQFIADGLSMSHWEARKRWTVLRDRYARELKQLLLHPDSMEYGKNEFFHRMDFLRSFVKKRRVRKKVYNSQGEELDDDERPRPIKIFKVDCNVNDFKTDDVDEQQQQDQKPYVIDDSQDSSTGKFSYIDNSSQEGNKQEHQHDTENHIDDELAEQDYQDYVEDTSGVYEAVEVENEALTHDISNQTLIDTHSTSTMGMAVIKPETTKIPVNYSITTIEDEDKSTSPPQLQQRPILQQQTPICNHTSPASEQNDSEEYFSKTIASYLKQLSRRYKIKAKVEMMQILEKYIDLEESEKNP